MGDRYVLGVDVGNTNTVFGLFRDEPDFEILHSWRTVTRRDRTSDELGIFLLGFLNSSGIVATEVGGFIYSSVVPPFSPIVERMGSDYFRCDPLRVRFDMGLPIGVSYPHPAEIGADRLANAAGAHAMCRDDLIIVDLGTATTFCLLEDGRPGRHHRSLPAVRLLLRLGRTPARDHRRTQRPRPQTQLHRVCDRRPFEPHIQGDARALRSRGRSADTARTQDHLAPPSFVSMTTPPNRLFSRQTADLVCSKILYIILIIYLYSLS